jgi:DNA replication and repair protein RecF
MPVLEKIVISDFRNIELQELEFSPNINCISGNNGEGKTNLLDAIYYLSMTKSAFATSDKFTFRHGTDESAISGTYRMDNGLTSRFALKMNSKGEKKVRRDDKQYGRVSEHIGVLPIVMVSPSDISMVSESGDER